MPLDPQLLEQVLRSPQSRDVTSSPLVTAVILRDPANAADLVGPLERPDTPEAKNARKILCLFGADAAPHLVHALRDAGANARKEGLEILWTLLFGESAWNIRDRLQAMATDLQALLDDRRQLPDFMPAHIERDFRGRICDLAYIVLRQLIDPRYDQSSFRSLDDDERNREIVRLTQGGFGPVLA